MGTLVFVCACGTEAPPDSSSRNVPEPQHILTAENTHAKFSSAIPPTLRVQSGAVVEIHTKEASDNQLSLGSEVGEVTIMDFDPVHPLTGPIYVEGAEPGDVLSVTLHHIESVDWGWTAIFPGFSFLADDFTEPYLRTFSIPPGAAEIEFTDRISVPLRPFPGVMGVAPGSDSMLTTIPPRANGGNMDNRHMTTGSTVYFPVFAPGALFSIGDAHAAQGDGEVCGTALESPMRVVLQLEVIKDGRQIREPEYETDEFYAVTGFGTTIDEAARKATRYMVDYLVAEHSLTRNDAFALCSLAGDLRIAEVVDAPHMLVSMHMPKSVLGM
jgi:acetamidase/formamidase